MILGVTGFKRSGKDTFAQPFIASGWQQVRFADTLKSMMRVLLLDANIEPLLIDEMLEGNSKEIPFEVLGNKTPRHAMQTLGTEWRNMIDPELWTRITRMKLISLRASGLSCIVTDVRFPHEVQALRKLNSRIVRVERAGCHATGHASEAHIESLPVDLVVVNNKDKEALWAEARRVMSFFS